MNPAQHAWQPSFCKAIARSKCHNVRLKHSIWQTDYPARQAATADKGLAPLQPAQIYEQLASQPAYGCRLYRIAPASSNCFVGAMAMPTSRPPVCLTQEQHHRSFCRQQGGAALATELQNKTVNTHGNVRAARQSARGSMPAGTQWRAAHPLLLSG